MNRFEFLKRLRLLKFKRIGIGQILLWGVGMAVAVGIFVFIRGMVDCWMATDLPGITLPTCAGGLPNPIDGPVINEQGTAISPDSLPPTPVLLPEAMLPPAWDGASRINILFFGLDYRDWEANEGPPRSDTMILFTVDPITKTAGMMSIPRDLWVNIPGFGYSRINTAYPSGEGNQLPGGGAGLAMRTVEQLLGVPVHYYVQIDFATFAALIDYIGGVEVWVEESLVLDPIGPGKDKFRVNCCGYRYMNGWRTLAYARTRKTEGGDIDRARRQQYVIDAIQRKIFDPQVFPKLIQNAPAIYGEFQAGIHTNMPLEDAIRLAVLGKDISFGSMKRGIIDTSMVTLDSVILGGQNANIMKPIMDKVRVLRDEIFTTSGPTSPIAQGDPASLMRNEEARVRILDGTFTPGLDQRAGVFFQGQGMNVTEVGAATEVYSSTLVVVHGPKLYTLRWLQSTFGISHTQIRFLPDPASTVDLEIRLGSDIGSRIQ
jgi:LCP family protein required for cell wall assembly